MKTRMSHSAGGEDLRKRAVSRLTGNTEDSVQRSAAALRVLYELAASPTTATDALAVLHELQVHQVELELQAEELHRLHAEAESALLRQTDFYNAAPVGLFAVDQNLVVQDANQTAATLLQRERADLPGQSLYRLLTPKSAESLHGLLARAAQAPAATCTLSLASTGAAPERLVHAAVSHDHTRGGFVVALMPTGT